MTFSAGSLRQRFEIYYKRSVIQTCKRKDNMKYDKDHKQIAMIERFINTKNKDVLEIGCGDGSISVILARDAQKYIAIDPDGEAIKKARLLTSNIDFQIGTGENLNFADSSFDIVIFILSLHHQNSQRALKEANRVLTHTGQLLILEPAADGELQQFFHLFNDESEALTNALNAIEQSNFRIVNHDIFNVLAEFNDHEDLCKYPLDRTIIDVNDCPRILGKLQQLRGSLSDIQLIHLFDKIHIFSLVKTLS